jgi:hypothetical protein
MRMRRQKLAATFVVPLLTGAIDSGCTTRIAAPQLQPAAARELSIRTLVYGHELTLHITPASVPMSPPVLYASGDGGWFGAAVGMYRAMADSELNVVGFSTKTFMNGAQERHGSLTPAHIVEGYQVIVDSARRALQLPDDVPVVLTGWSRGASLGVLVAGDQHVDPQVTGVVAIGLAAQDHLGTTGENDDDPEPNAAPSTVAGEPREGSLDLYGLISRIAPRRCAVIQASKDSYLPASLAHDLFGADSDVKRFMAIEAHNHRFDNGETAFVTALRAAIRWAAGR